MIVPALPAPRDGVASRRVLIAAIDPRADALAGLLLDSRITAAVDWDWVLERATTHRVGALVATRIAASAVAPTLAPSILTRLDDIRRQAAERAAASQRTLRELEVGLRDSHVPFLLLKGSILAELVYREPLIRPFYDIDVVVPRARLSAAEALLCSWGFHMSGTWPLLGRRPAQPVGDELADAVARRFYLAVFHNLSYAPRRDDQRRPIELHWNIAPRGRLRVRDEQLWQRTTTVRVAGVNVRTLDPEATLIHLAVHALEPWFHGFKLLHLCDVAWMLATAAPRAAALWQLAEDWGAVYHLELALRLTGHLFAVPAAGSLLGERRSSPWMRAALSRVGDARVLIERKIGPQDPWLRRAAIELGWGLAVKGLRAKLIFSAGRRIAALRWHLARRLSARAGPLSR